MRSTAIGGPFPRSGTGRCECSPVRDTSVAHLGLSLLATVVRAVAGAVPRSLDRPALGRARGHRCPADRTYRMVFFWEFTR